MEDRLILSGRSRCGTHGMLRYLQRCGWGCRATTTPGPQGAREGVSRQQRGWLTVPGMLMVARVLLSLGFPFDVLNWDSELCVTGGWNSGNTPDCLVLAAPVCLPCLLQVPGCRKEAGLAGRAWPRRISSANGPEDASQDQAGPGCTHAQLTSALLSFRTQGGSGL